MNKDLLLVMLEVISKLNNNYSLETRSTQIHQRPEVALDAMFI